MNGILALLALAMVMGTQNSKDPVLLTVGPEEVTQSEFEYIFEKNNNVASVEEEDLREYIDLYSKFRMKVLDAEAAYLDTSAEFKKELEGYRKQLARPYLTDKQAEEELVKEAYERMQYEVRASHILVMVDEDALPADTLAAYEKIQSYRAKIAGGEEFAAVAYAHSEDPSARTNNGDLGYFSAFRMVYPFESAVYNTPVGELSKPFRTRFGYHLVQVMDKRPTRGELKVAHIMVKDQAKSTEQEKQRAQEKLKQLQEYLAAGEPFEKLVRFSDDQSSAKKKGELPWFSTGQMVPAFEEAAYALEKTGEVSEVVKTMYGWHIIKLLDKKELPSFEEAKSDIKRKIKRDSRASKGVETLVANIKKEHSYKADLATIEPFYSIDLQERWTGEGFVHTNETMFSLAGKAYTQADFVDFIVDNQTATAAAKTRSAVYKLYESWVSKSCIAHENTLLEEKHPEFKALMKEYRDGILLFDLMDEKVWSKAVKDTLGLQQYYELTKESYRWGARVDASLYTCLDEAIAQRLRTLLSSRSPKLSDAELAVLTLGKGELSLSSDDILTVMNRENALNVQAESRTFAKGESLYLDRVPWAKGLTANQAQQDGSVVFANIYDVLAPQMKTFEEAKGQLTSDYQDYLEAAWVKELQEKYPVVINEEVLENILKNDAN
jgi:peptidyl-prolyl cis-trans isomerase SurA